MIGTPKKRGADSADGGASMYQLELHCHCAGVSACAHAQPDTVIARYRAAGYHGLVCTNHINIATFAAMEDRPWPEKVAHFMTGYRQMQQAAGNDLTVLLGCEINLTGAGNDYLIYGVTEDWLLELGDPRRMKLRELSERVHADGLMIFQAHPFRYGMTLMDERLLDGIETHNGHRFHDSHNDMAAAWASLKGLRRISGSDFHDPDSAIAGGILTETPITDNAVLLQTLRAGNYHLIT